LSNAIGLTPGGCSKYTFTHKSAGRAPFLPVIPWHLPYTEEGRKNLSQGSQRLLVYILPKRTHYKTHSLQNRHLHTPTHYKIHTYTPTHYKTHVYTHIRKQFKTTTVQM